jgi:hypothetical protein
MRARDDVVDVAFLRRELAAGVLEHATVALPDATGAETPLRILHCLRY